MNKSERERERKRERERSFERSVEHFERAQLELSTRRSELELISTGIRAVDLNEHCVAEQIYKSLTHEHDYELRVSFTALDDDEYIFIISKLKYAVSHLLEALRKRKSNLS